MKMFNFWPLGLFRQNVKFGLFRADWFFFGRWRMQGNARTNKKEKNSTEKSPKSSIKLSLKTSDTVKGLWKRKRLYACERESMYGAGCRWLESLVLGITLQQDIIREDRITVLSLYVRTRRNYIDGHWVWCRPLDRKNAMMWKDNTSYLQTGCSPEYIRTHDLWQREVGGRRSL